MKYHKVKAQSWWQFSKVLWTRDPVLQQDLSITTLNWKPTHLHHTRFWWLPQSHQWLQLDWSAWRWTTQCDWCSHTLGPDRMLAMILTERHSTSWQTGGDPNLGLQTDIVYLLELSNIQYYSMCTLIFHLIIMSGSAYNMLGYMAC